MKKTLGVLVLFSLFIPLTFAQSKIVTTGDNQINTADPYGADIVIGSDAGTRHDASIMMNKILLKKIEELTLYVMEQGKEIKSLKAKMNKR